MFVIKNFTFAWISPVFIYKTIFAVSDLFSKVEYLFKMFEPLFFMAVITFYTQSPLRMHANIKRFIFTPFPSL